MLCLPRMKLLRKRLIAFKYAKEAKKMEYEEAHSHFVKNRLSPSEYEIAFRLY